MSACVCKNRDKAKVVCQKPVTRLNASEMEIYKQQSDCSQYFTPRNSAT